MVARDGLRSGQVSYHARCFEEGAHAYADAVLDDLTKPGSEAFVPILWRYEVSSVLARAQLAGQLEGQKVTRFIALLGPFAIRADEESGRRIVIAHTLRRLSIKGRIHRKKCLIFHSDKRDHFQFINCKLQ